MQSCARSSEDIVGMPRAASIRITVVLPEAIPPVTPRTKRFIFGIEGKKRFHGRRHAWRAGRRRTRDKACLRAGRRHAVFARTLANRKHRDNCGWMIRDA